MSVSGVSEAILYKGDCRKEKHTLGDRLDEGSEDEGEIVTWVETMPKGRCGEGGQAGAEAGLLASRGHTQVYVVAQPLVGVDVPGLQIAPGVLGKFHTPRVDVLEAIPCDLTR